MNEKPKRLTPKKEIVRELYMKSGNQCSFPDCIKVIINSNGKYIGQLVHIKAVMPKEPRFDLNTSNEEKREFSNLTLMCYEHHIETNDEDKYPKEVMYEIKSNHEKKYTDIISSIQKYVTDHTRKLKPTYPKTLKNFFEKTNIVRLDEEVSNEIKQITDLINRLKKVPINTRKTLQIMIERGEIDSIHEGLVMPATELIEVCNLQENQYRDLIAILDKYDLAHEIGYNFDNIYEIEAKALKGGWTFWDNLKEFSNKTLVPLEKIVVELNFQLLD